MLRLRLLSAGVLAIVAGQALAHGGHEHRAAPGWTLEPMVTVPLALLLLLFLIGRWRLGRRSSVPRRRPWLFLGGWLVLSLALTSPLHEGGERSFTLHMAEHELIMLVAALLLAASHAGGILPGDCQRQLAAFWPVAGKPRLPGSGAGSPGRSPPRSCKRW